MLKNVLRKKNSSSSKPQQKSNHRLQQVADYQPGDCLKEGTKYSSFCQSSKGCEKKWGSTHQQRQLATVCADVVYHRNFSSAGWTEQRILPATLRQAGPSRRLPDITLLDMMTFVALALQMGHALKDTIHDHWSGLRQLHNPFYGKTMTRDRILHILHFLRIRKLRTVCDKLN